MPSHTVNLNGSATFYGILTVNESVANAGANTSDVSYSLQLDPPGNYASYSLTASSNSYSININGVVISGNFTYDFRSPNGNVTKTIKSGSVTGIAHNYDGSKTITATASINTSNANIGDGSMSVSVPLTDFVRLPSTPSVTSYRSGDGGTFRSDLYGSTFYGSGAAYRSYWRYANSGGWNGPYANSQNVTVDRYYKVVGHGHAYDSEGWTGAGEYYIPGVPAAPGTAVSKPARQSVSITVNSAPWNSGEADITGYYSQHSLDNVNWDSPIYMNSNTLTYTGLSPGRTHYFRTFAVSNWYWGDMNNYSTFIPVGGKIHNGTSFVQASAPKVFNGTSWVDLTNAKVYNGSAWVDLG